MASVIIARDLFKCYPGFAPVLRGVNIEVEPGEMAAIMGPSGCGKSTMLHVLGMLHAPDSGTLQILNTNVLALGREQTAAFRRENMGFVMQSSNLFEHSTVFENVEFPLIYENVPPQERWERVIRALELVRLSARVHYRSNRLSGGEQQRVAIARAMVNNPRILLADEPTGALDARTSRLIMENFRSLCHSGGVSMVMVTHDPKMAEYCDSIYTLDDGILNCKKRELVPYAAKDNGNFLKPPTPLVRGALVAEHFPDPEYPGLQELARHMHKRALLSRIYSTAHSAFLGNPEGYSLPLAVRHIGLWPRIRAFGAFFHRARGSESLWSLWRRLPAHASIGKGFFSQLGAFASGTLLARWGLEDGIQFYFASGAGNEATAAWVAARLLRLPFSFTARCRDFARFGPDWMLKAQNAAFIACPSLAAKEKLCDLLPDLPKEKIILLHEPVAVAPGDEEQDAVMPANGDKPVLILTMGAKTSASGFETVIKACSILKNNGINFRLTILGARTWKSRWLIWRGGLRHQASFTGRLENDSLSELFKSADIFVATIPSESGGNLALPMYVCEAMLWGLAIVSSGLSAGMREALKDGRNTLVAPARDAVALASCLEKLAGNNGERRILGDAARLDARNLLDTQADSKILADLIVEASAARQNKKIAKSGNPDRS